MTNLGSSILTVQVLSYDHSIVSHGAETFSRDHSTYAIFAMKTNNWNSRQMTTKKRMMNILIFGGVI